MLGSIPFFKLFRDYFIGSIQNDVSYCMVFAIGVAITSIPVISKIFFDMGIMNTHFSNTVLTVSTFQDLLLWIMLNAATRIASTGELRLPDMLIVVAVTLGLFVIAKLISDRAKTKDLKINAISFYSCSFVILLLVHQYVGNFRPIR